MNNPPVVEKTQPLQPAVASPLPARLSSIDAYRGFVMLLMMAEVLRFSQVANANPGNAFWHFLAFHQTHVQWIGCSLHDMIQPSFSFLVGVSLPFSLAGRAARGKTRGQIALHAFWRCLILICLGIFLRSVGQPQTNWMFTDTLGQIGLGYGFLVLLGYRPVHEQWIALAAILVGYWAAFAMYPVVGPEFNYVKVGVPAGWPHLLSGFEAHWNKNSNFAWAFDTWFLNLFPRQQPFVFNPGGYCTLSFIPTLGTMVFGLIAGGVLHGQRAPWAKAKWLVLTGFLALLLGLLIGVLGLCPIVKRIWTPSWTLFSGGLCFLFLAGFYTLMELLGRKAWAFPLLVIGMNSIAAYCIADLCDSFIGGCVTTHLGAALKIFGPAYEPLVHGALVLLGFWLILLWMYRRKIFLRV